MLTENFDHLEIFSYHGIRGSVARTFLHAMVGRGFAQKRILGEESIRIAVGIILHPLKE